MATRGVNRVTIMGHLGNDPDLRYMPNGDPKGTKLYIEGRLQTRKWTDQNGIDHYVTEVIANNVQLVDSKQGSSYPPPQGEKRPPAQGNAATAAGANHQGSKQTPPGPDMDEEPPLPSEIPNYEGMDDEIPF